MRLGLTDVVVLVTGGSKGIGLACAEAFAGEGAKVAIASRRRENLASAEAHLAGAGHPVASCAADLRDPAAAQRLVAAVEARLGPIGVLVNCAGDARRYTPDELDAEAWREGMGSKYFPYVHAMQAVLPGMKARGRGAIVNVVGQGGKVASPVHLPGGAANSALLLASTGLAKAYARSGVRINCINPGRTIGERAIGAFQAEARRLGITPDDVRSREEQAIPLGRFASPKEIADVALFLASDRASYVTGISVAMDGGLTSTVV